MAGEKRRSRSRLEVLDYLRHVRAPDDLQPPLHVALMLELRVLSVTRRGEELVEIELIELTGPRDREQLE